MHSVSDLTTSSRRTTGDVPPKLVGASTTVVGNKMYLFGGRLVTERRMVSDLYMFDMETFVWQKMLPHPEDNVPGARYFHSTDSWRNHLVVFGGMGHKPDTTTTDDLCVLNDVRFFDLTIKRWLPAEQQAPLSNGSSEKQQPAASTNGKTPFVPLARYAHLSSVTAHRLFVIGGQDLNNLWLDDICVFDLEAGAWVHRRQYPRHSGTYRSVAVSANMRTRFPADEAKVISQNSATIGPLGSRYKVDRRPASAKGDFTPSEKLVHLPYSADPSDDFPNDIYLYSNYNFTDVKRELEIFKPMSHREEFQVEDHSTSMTGTVLPPGLRFPTGAICGTHLIFAGTYLAHSYQSYSIWALDLQTMTWSRLDPGSALSTGSWFRACLWSAPGNSKFLIFGNRAGNLVEDYNRRLLSWDDVAVIDLEAFGIYQAPTLTLDLKAQELGLAALEEELFADFEVICDDGRKIGCSRKILEARWPWFKDQRKLLIDAATKAMEAIPSVDGELPLPLDPTAEARPPGEDEPRLDPRLSSRSLVLSEPFPITLALLQYFYTLALVTPLQHAPAVLSQLMLLSATYNLPHLQLLVKHAMHRALTPATSVGVYEVATLCSCQSLQIRALKSVMASSRRSAGRSRGNSGGANNGSGGGGGGGSGNDGGGGHHGAARPRGMSDLRGIARGTDASGSGSAIHNGGAVNGRTHANSNLDGARQQSGHGRAEGSVSSAKAIPSHMRMKHSANLSMDSMYQALKAADAENERQAAEAEVVTSTLGSSSTTDSFVQPTAVSTTLKRVASHPALVGAVAPSTFTFPVARPSIVRTQSHSSLQSSKSKASSSQTPRPTPHFIEDERSTRSDKVESSYSFSSSDNSVDHPHHISRLGIPSHGRGLSPVQLGDGSSDTPSPSLSSSSQQSLVGAFPSTPPNSSALSHSPLTPDSPLLRTPLDNYGSLVGGLTSSSIPAAVMTLEAIEERSTFDESLHSPEPVAPKNTIEVQVIPPSSKGKQKHTRHEQSQVKRDRSPSWSDLKATFIHTKSRRLSPSALTPESLSPATPTSATDRLSPTDGTVTPLANGRNRADSQLGQVGSGGGITIARAMFGSKPPKVERESANGGFVERHLQGERLHEQLAQFATAESLDISTPPNSPPLSSSWSTTTTSSNENRLSMKVFRATEKQKRKEEQRKKLEQLAEQLKASQAYRKSQLVTAPVNVAPSSEWLEETDGMYGTMRTWGGL